MNELLEKVRNMQGGACVTITMNTYSTLPEREQNAPMLKNLVREAETRLYEMYDKRTVWPVAENLKREADSVNWDRNDKSLVIFANADFAGSTRLPVEVTDRSVVDDRFATRDLVRAMHEEFTYYLLVLNRNEARLFEAFNDSVVRELGDEFSLANPLYTTDKLKQSMKEGSDNYINEFFNQVDKALWSAVAAERKPLILVTEARNFSYYRRNTDHPDMIIGYIPYDPGNSKAADIVHSAWPDIREMLREGDIARISELREAGGLLTRGLSAVWNAIDEGRAATLFVRKGFHQPAKVVSNPDTGDFEVLTTGASSLNNKAVMDDIIDEMIGRTIDAGGEVVFIDGDQLEPYGNVALVARYVPAEVAETV